MSEPADLLADMMSLLTELRSTLARRGPDDELSDAAPAEDWVDREAGPDGGGSGFCASQAVEEGPPYRETVQQLQAEVTRWQQQSVELQNVALTVREELEQTRGQRNVAWRELETVRRRWQQEVSEYEQRLNACRAERDRLQRELEAIRAAGISTEEAPRRGAHTETRQEAASPALDFADSRIQPESAPAEVHRGRDLRRVFSRLRDRDAQAPGESTPCPYPNSTATRSPC
jgi:hypothetical protein